MFHIGALSSLLPPGTSQYSLAQEISAHMCSVRGYRWAFSGYHACGPGFWLSAAYYGDGLFLVDGSRNHGKLSEIDLLIRAFQSHLAQPDDPGMLDPALYAESIVYLARSPKQSAVRVKQDILSSPDCSLVHRNGHKRVAIVEFLPLTSLAAASHAPPAPSPTAILSPQSSAPSPSPASRALQAGDVCPVCRAEVKERALFMGTFIGCLC
jgi:hypothetical protein